MLVPNPNRLLSLLGLELEDILFVKRSDRRLDDPFTHRTFMNAKNGKGKSRPPKPDIILPWMAKMFGLDGESADRFASAAPELMETNDGPWGLMCAVASMDGVPRLEFREAKRFEDASRDMWPYLVAGDAQTLASKLERLDLPRTETLQSTIIRLRALNDQSPEAIKLALVPLALSNLLYLICCRDMGIGLVDDITPRFGDDGDILSLSRFMDAFRNARGLRSDAKLGEIFYPRPAPDGSKPGWDPDSSKREMAKWRKGSFPTWGAIRTMARRAPNIDARQDIYQTFFLIRLMHWIYDFGGELEGQIAGFERRALFGEIPQLQDYAGSRAEIEQANFVDPLPES